MKMRLVKDLITFTHCLTWQYRSISRTYWASFCVNSFSQRHPVDQPFVMRLLSAPAHPFSDAVIPLSLAGQPVPYWVVHFSFCSNWYCCSTSTVYHLPTRFHVLFCLRHSGPVYKYGCKVKGSCNIRCTMALLFVARMDHYNAYTNIVNTSISCFPCCAISVQGSGKLLPDLCLHVFSNADMILSIIPSISLSVSVLSASERKGYSQRFLPRPVCHFQKHRTTVWTAIWRLLPFHCFLYSSA